MLRSSGTCPSDPRADYKITNQDGTSIITDIKQYLISASFSVWNKLFRTSLFEGEMHFPEKIKYEDFALMPRIYERAKKIVSRTDKLYYYYYRQNSTTTGVKINEDILRAQHILEDSDFGMRNKEIVEIYFVRQVMGTLLWAMTQKGGSRSKVLEIVHEGQEKYPDIAKYMTDNYIGSYKSLWGKLLLRGYYNVCRLYRCTYECFRWCGKKIKSII